MKRRLLIALAALALIAAACGGGDGDGAADATTVAPATEAPSTTEAMDDENMDDENMDDENMDDENMDDEMMGHDISFTTDGWPELAGGALYEGWLIIDGEAVSTGVFNVVDGVTVDVDGNVVEHFPVEADTTAASAVVVTIEPANDSDPLPSDTHFVAGDITAGVADLTIGHPAALGTDFSSAAGSFVLATPTDGDATNDELSGVWFLEFPGPEASLDLPELPDGWTYEGWVVIDGTPVTTGTFLATDASDDAAPYSGTVRTPNFPGEDFLQNAPEGLTFPTNLQGTTVVISVEPIAEDNPLPFALKPLVGPVPADAETEPTSYPLSNADFAAPTGVATIN